MKHHGNAKGLSIPRSARKLGRLLSKNNLTLAVAESCTGGMIGAAITAIPGSSSYFKGGVIAYANEIKRRLLGVPAGILKSKGAVSAQTARAMARGAQRLFHADLAVSVTGIAGPGGGTKKKPVGLVYVGIALRKKVRSYRYLVKGGREQVRRQTVRAALEMTMQEVTKRQRDKAT